MAVIVVFAAVLVAAILGVAILHVLVFLVVLIVFHKFLLLETRRLPYSRTPSKGRCNST